LSPALQNGHAVEFVGAQHAAPRLGTM